MIHSQQILGSAIPSLGLAGILLAGAGFFVGGCGGGTNDSKDGNQQPQEIDCGDLTCASDEFCLTREPSPFGPGGDLVRECVTIPSSCGNLSLCDCPATDGDWEGAAVKGCSILGGRDLTVTDAHCGSARCGPSEGCIVFDSNHQNQEPAPNNYCHPLPDGCQVSFDFCATDCARRLAEAAGEAHQGCIGANWGVAAIVTSSP